MAQQAQRSKEQSSPPPASVPPGIGKPGPEAGHRLTRRGVIILVAVLLVLNVPVIHRFLLRGAPEAHVTVPYRDDFSAPSTVADNYFSTGGHWRVVEGRLLSPGVKNNPLWLAAKLPADVAVEFDVRSESPEGDVKVELFGDGTDHASGYVLIHGGWNNSKSIIARLDEHGRSLEALQAEAVRLAGQRGSANADLVETGVFTESTRMRVEAHPFPVTVGQTYRWRIERKGHVLRWSIDGKPFMEFADPFPLKGKGHDRFGFSSWMAQLYFDNLVITPL